VGYVAIKDTIVDYTNYYPSIKKFADNPSIDCILLDINSGGGSASVAQIIAELINKIKEIKPVIVFISGTACSAAYWITAAASHSIATSLAEVGSIGVAWQAVQDQNFLKTYIVSGKYKVPYTNTGELIDDEIKAHIQKEIDRDAEEFFSFVATARAIPFNTVKDFQAKVFSGRTAAELGLIDEVGALDAVIKKITKDIEDKNGSSYHTIELINSDNVVISTFDTIR
jgi:protease-4